jgi:broad-specificity NMP kinase
VKEKTASLLELSAKIRGYISKHIDHDLEDTGKVISLRSMEKYLETLQAQGDAQRKTRDEMKKERTLAIHEKEIAIEQEKTKISCYTERKHDLEKQIAEVTKKLSQRKKGSTLNNEMKETQA